MSQNMVRKTYRPTHIVKIGLLYTISNFVVQGMAFLTTPIFSRLLTTAEYGEFSNISSWASILAIVATFQVYISILSAKYDYKDSIKEYMTSILLLGNIVTLIFWGIVEFQLPFFERIFSMDRLYIRFIFIYAMFSPAMQILMYKHRVFSEYKGVICYTFITAISTIGSSVFLVVFMSDKLLGRMIGNYLSITLVNIVLWIYIILNGRHCSFKHWRYALNYSVPLIPHELAGRLLTSSDRIIIKQLCGAEDAGLYSLAYNVSLAATILLSSMNQAWQPWMNDKLKAGKEEQVTKYYKVYTLFFALGCLLIMLLGPEVVLILGSQKYMSAVYVIPPVCLGIMLQFVYTLYANIEFLNKLTGWISMATFVSSALNIVLNFIFIPRFGYLAAAYTTVAGFAVMAILHYFVVKIKTKYGSIFNVGFFALVIAIEILGMVGAIFLYSYTILRYIIIGLLGSICIVLIMKNKQVVANIRNDKEK